MALVTSKEMLLKAQEGGYAVGAFNAENMEMVKAIIQAAEELKAPVMIHSVHDQIRHRRNLRSDRCSRSKESICSGMPPSGSRQQL